MLIAATITTGLVAGLLFGFACAVMPGLSRVDDAAFVAVMQSINRRILNGAFLVCFAGAPLLTVASLVLEVVGDGHTWVPIAGAVLLTVVSYLITATVNVPLNNAVDSAGAMERSAARARSAPCRPPVAGPPAPRSRRRAWPRSAGRPGPRSWAGHCRSS